MITIERLVPADSSRLWDLVSDVEHWDRMLPSVSEVTRIEGTGPVGVGDRFELRQPGMPRAVYEITGWRPGRGFTWEASSPGIRTTASHELTPQRGGTLVRLGVDWSGPFAPIARLVYRGKVHALVGLEADTFTALVTSKA